MRNCEVTLWAQAGERKLKSLLEGTDLGIKMGFTLGEPAGHSRLRAVRGEHISRLSFGGRGAVV